MNKFVRVLSFFLCVLLLLTGCGEKPKPIKQSSVPSGLQIPDSHLKKYPEAEAAQQAANQEGAVDRILDKNILITDVLKRKDLSPAAREKFLELKGIGVPEMRSSRVEKIISENSAAAIKSRYTDYRDPAKGMIPTLAKTTPSKKEVKYSSKPHRGYERYFGRLEFERMGLEHFKTKKVGPLLSAPNKTRTIKFMEDVISAKPYRDSKRTWEKLLAEAQTLAKIQQGPRYDPFFMYCHALVTDYGGRPAEAIMILENALDKFAKDDYPARVVVQAHYQLVNAHPKEISGAVWVKKAAKYYAAVDYWLSSDFRAQPHEHQYVLENINSFTNSCVTHGDWEMLDAFIESFSQQTHLPDWVRSMVRGNYYSVVGWGYRGSGMANTVSDEGWKKFKEHQTKAAGFFKQAHQFNPLFPESAMAMIDICRTGHSDETQDFWFEKAIEADANFYAAYTNRLHGLTPQWGGSFEKMIEFARHHALKPRDDASMVPYLLIECRNSILGRTDLTQEARETYLETPEFRSDVIKSIDLLMKSEHGPLLGDSIRDKNFLLTLKAVYSVQFGDMDTAHDTFDKLGKKLNNKALDIARVDAATLKAFRSPSFALTSEYQAEARELEKLFGDSYEHRLSNSREILELADNVLRENTDPTGSIFFKKIRDQVLLERAYANGREIKLPFDPTMMLWECGDIRHFEFESKDSVFVDNRKLDLTYMLTSIVRTPGSKVIELDIEYPEDKQPGASSVLDLTPSVVPAMMHTASNRLAIGLSRDFKENRRASGNVKDRRAKLWYGFAQQTSTKYVYQLNLIPRTAKLRIFIAKEYFEVYVNDKFVMRTHRPDVWAVKNYFVLTQPTCLNGRGKFKISNIRLKQWDGKPRPYQATNEELVTNYAKHCKENPKDKWFAFWLAHAYHKSNKLQEALEQYKKSIELGIPESVAGFYLGDVNDRLEQYDEAKKWYEIAANQETEDRTEMPRIADGYAYSNPQNWAAYRLAWINRTSPDEAIRKSHNENDFASIYLPHKVAWIEKLVWAQRKAVEGDFAGAEAKAKTILSNCSVEMEQRVMKIIAAYQAGKPYVHDSKNKPFYMHVEKTIPFFRHFEDGIPPAYVRAWQRSPRGRLRIRSTD